jgi:hypothetical protein
VSFNKILLHCCCAPCSTYVIAKLKETFEVYCYFYGPNIHPEAEYKKRLQEMLEYSAKIGVPCICGGYDTDKWFKAMSGLEHEPEGGKRCFECYRVRLDETAQVAKNMEIRWFTTTLSISPHKNAVKINELGKSIGVQYGVNFLEANFKKQDGFKKSICLSKRAGLYRQNYCGCTFSKIASNKRCESKE